MKLRIILIILIFLMTLIAHEVTHYEIFRSYECKDIHFGIGRQGIYTTAICPNEDGRLAYNINNVVGYNIIPILMFILALMIMEVKNG